MIELASDQMESHSTMSLAQIFRLSSLRLLSTVVLDQCQSCPSRAELIKELDGAEQGDTHCPALAESRWPTLWPRLVICLASGAQDDKGSPATATTSAAVRLNCHLPPFAIYIDYYWPL